MSCTVSLIPFLLIGAIGGIASNLNRHDAFRDELLDELNERPTIDIGGTEYIPANFTSEQLIDKVFETNFMDKQLLIKTLNEHGVTNCTVSENDSVFCDIEGYRLNFERENNQNPYHLTISCPEKNNMQMHVDDLTNEYSLNVQEKSYENIIEGLKAKNLDVESEEVLDDNSIVITVNLE